MSYADFDPVGTIVVRSLGGRAGARAGATGAGNEAFAGRKERKAAIASIASRSLSTASNALPTDSAAAGPPSS